MTELRDDPFDDPGATALDPYTFGHDQMCFGCGPHNPHGLRLRFRREGDTVTTRFTLGSGHDGPPGILHGGLQAMVCDEVAGWTLVGLRDRMGLTTSMSIRYIRSLRLDQEILGVGEITAETPTSCTIRVTLSQNGKVGCMTRASFAMADGDKMEAVLEGPLPEGWRRFFDGVEPTEGSDA
ncbi:MAG: acyl-coenzyme A thioesterase PaaI-like protein [Myxococcota bacterium]|jgi:acyl-coenzyme A thioesterase PaaI-like protein